MRLLSLDDYSIDGFIHEINEYMQWYCRDRIKTTLGGLSPLDYRRSIGVCLKKCPHLQGTEGPSAFVFVQSTNAIIYVNIITIMR